MTALNRNPGSMDQCVKTFRMEVQSGNICDARQQQTVVFSKDSISRQLNPNGWADDRSYVGLSLDIDLSPTGGAATNLDVPFVFMGERSTYWNLYFGWGILVGVLLLALAGILWILSDVTTLRPRSSGAISAVISTTSLVGAYLSFHFFYIPPFVLYSIICTTLLAATLQLLNKRNE